MGRRIELPKLPAGQTQEQLQALYSYLYQMAEALNNNLAEIGNGGFTDEEMVVVREITGQTETADGMAEAETLKSLIIKTAQLIKSEIDAYNLKLTGTYEAEGKLGRYVRKTRLDVDVTPTGIQQNYTFQDIIQGLKTYEVNAKNYIKTGLLRTVNNVPVYGVAIGKDVVTFSNDGTETYNDGNKVAELTADELSFWQNGNKVAGYTGERISFYYNNTEVFYIQAGKLYAAADLEITAGKKLKIVSGGTLEVDTSNFKINSDDKNMVCGKWKFYDGGIKYTDPGSAQGTDKILEFLVLNNEIVISKENQGTGELGRIKIGLHPNTYGNGYLLRPCLYSDNLIIGKSTSKALEMWAVNVCYENLYQSSSRSIKHDIRDMESRGDVLDRLRPVTFVYDEDPEEKTRAGLIYEETEPVLPEICTGDEGNKAINYMELVPILLKEIQELRARVKALEEGGNENG